MRHTLQLAIVLVLGVFGCEAPTPPSGPPIPEVNASEPAASTPIANPPPRPAYQPEYTLTIEPNASGAGSVVKWTAFVNSGGWTMATDKVLVEDSMGATVARVYIILEEPGPDEMVTQALETLRGEHATEQVVTKAELSVKRNTRGADTGGFAALYSIVKTAP